jgi:uncharacterized RDD family membrane protein YckC
MPGWKPFAEAGPAVPLPPPIPESVPLRFCSGCGKQFPATELALTGNSALCAACQPAWHTQAPPAWQKPAPGPFHYGGFWIRFCAYVLDHIIIGTAQLVLFIAMFGGTILGIIRDAISGNTSAETALDALPLAFSVRFGSFLLTLAYFAWCWSQYGATPGKMAFGLKVVNPDGSHVSLPQAVGRYLGTILSGLVMGIGFIMAGFDNQKRALHDRLASTRVIQTR